MKKLSLVFTLTILFAQVLHGQDARRGTLKGVAVDAETREPLIGVNIVIEGAQLGAATDLDGNFEINQVPVGSYAVVFSYIGYESHVKTDVIVRSRRITFVEATLRQSTIETETVVADPELDLLGRDACPIGVPAVERHLDGIDQRLLL